MFISDATKIVAMKNVTITKGPLANTSRMTNKTASDNDKTFAAVGNLISFSYPYRLLNHLLNIPRNVLI